jgi:hypothetical protein
MRISRIPAAVPISFEGKAYAIRLLLIEKCPDGGSVAKDHDHADNVFAASDSDFALQGGDNRDRFRSTLAQITARTCIMIAVRHNPRAPSRRINSPEGPQGPHEGPVK